MDLHLRVDINEEFDYLAFQDFIVATFNPVYLLVTKEVSKQEQKDHLHIYINTDLEITTKFDTFRKNINKLLKDQFNLEKHNKALQLIETEEEVDKLIVYILKDGNIITNNIPEDKLMEYIEKTEQINEDKKVPMYQKVYDKLKDKKIKDTYSYIKEITTLYIEEFNQAPPQRHIIINAFQYYLYKKNNFTALYDLLNIPNVVIEDNPPIPDNLFIDD